jgi:N-(2-amino-2-carboxyethyl)-L-glutamate synthase
LEEASPSGSVKDRTAAGLLRALAAAAPLEPGAVIVESSSGNLALALATLVQELGVSFIELPTPLFAGRTSTEAPPIRTSMQR